LASWHRQLNGPQTLSPFEFNQRNLNFMTQITRNPFKTALTQGHPQIGLWLSMADPYLAEVSATAGFDWLLIDGEHAPNDLRSTLAALQAVAPYRSQPVVRVVAGEVAMIKQLLDIGAQNLLIPMIDTAEQARMMVSATRYPPQGIRGVGSAVGRASRWSARTDYLDAADGEVCLLIQAETVTALQHLEDICAVSGIDGVFIGPADLAASMGHRGKPGHPEVQAAIEKAILTIVASGKAAGTLTSDPVLARRYLSLGCTFVATGVDILLYANAARRLAVDFALTPSTPTLTPGAAY
jgi:4-hydroxy-2-oxoheptanedioate aldolase